MEEASIYIGRTYLTQVWTYLSKLEETKNGRDEAPKTVGEKPRLLFVASSFHPCYPSPGHKSKLGLLEKHWDICWS